MAAQGAAGLHRVAVWRYNCALGGWGAHWRGVAGLWIRVTAL